MSSEFVSLIYASYNKHFKCTFKINISSDYCNTDVLVSLTKRPKKKIDNIFHLPGRKNSFLNDNFCRYKNGMNK